VRYATRVLLIFVAALSILFGMPAGAVQGNDNLAPQVTNPGDQENTEGDTVSLQISAADPDDDLLNYDAEDLPADLSIDASTGLISGNLTYESAGTYSANVTVSDGTADVSATFTWTVINATQTITATAGAGGSISPSGAVIVDYGDNQTFTILPDSGYCIADVIVDDISAGSLTTYTFTAVTANHTIEATFDVVTITIKIDIKPGSDPNSINPNSNGVIPVAILTTGDFDATTVDPDTVLFGPSEAAPVHCVFVGVDNDGDTDMLLHFRTQETGIGEGDTEATLTGKTIDGTDIIGTDSVRIVPPEGKGKGKGNKNGDSKPGKGKGRGNGNGGSNPGNGGGQGNGDGGSNPGDGGGQGNGDGDSSPGNGGGQGNGNSDSNPGKGKGKGKDK